MTLLWFGSREILLIEEQKLMLKITIPKWGELLSFPSSVKEGVMYVVEKHVEPNFQSKALKLNVPTPTPSVFGF